MIADIASESLSARPCGTKQAKDAGLDDGVRRTPENASPRTFPSVV